MADTEQAPGADAPITPPAASPGQAQPVDAASVEQASAAQASDQSDTSDSPAADPDAEHLAYLKSLPPSKLLELREDLAKHQQDEINRGIQRTLDKQREKERKEQEAAARAQARADARAAREAERAQQRELVNKVKAEDWDATAQAAQAYVQQVEPTLYQPDPEEAEDNRKAWEQWSLGQASAGISNKIYADILNEPLLNGIDPDEITSLIDRPTFTQMAFAITKRAGGATPDEVKSLEAKHATELEAAKREARAEALGELPGHDVPRGVGASNGNGHVWTREELQNMPMSTWKQHKASIEAQYAAGLIR